LQLPAPASAVESAASMEATPTAEPGPTTRWGETVESTASARYGAAAESAVKSDSAASIKCRPAPVEPAASVEAMEPGTRANKHAPGKIIRPIVAVRRARVRRVPVIAVGAYRSWTDVAWPKSNSNPDLRMGSSRPRYQHEKPEHHSVL